jgi:hypothetical protein
LKKLPETDAIFENVFAANQSADEHPKTLRLSIDSKAKVKIGNLSRGGKDRGLEAVQADDHDSEWQGASQLCSEQKYSRVSLSRVL